MPSLADKFLTGRPKGVSQVAKDAAGRLSTWLENGFEMQVVRDGAGKPLAVTANSQRASLVWRFTYDASGRMLRSDGDQIPTVFKDELLRDVHQINHSADGDGVATAVKWQSAGRTRISELLGRHTSLIHPDAGDRATVGGVAWTVQGNGKEWTYSGIDNSLNGFVKDGIPGILERVPDTADTSSYTNPAAAFAWRLIVDSSHVVTEGAPRTQINGPSLALRRRHFIEFDIRLQSDWNYTEQSESGLIFQLQQFDVNRRAQGPGQDEAPVVALNMTGLSARFDLLAYQAGDFTYVDGRPQYGAGDRAPWSSRVFAMTRTRYTRIVIDYTPDDRSLDQGGIGHLAVMVNGQLVGEYRGPTLKPAPDGGDVLPPTPKLAWYQWSTPASAGTVNSAAGMTASRSIFIRKFRISEV